MDELEVLQRLIVGNAAYVEGGAYQGEIGQAKRNALSDRQKPIAVVVTCSDSRVVPEVIFNAGLGELFVIRVAGNVLGDTELASIEYATHHLGCRLVVILGHTACGAIAAAIAGEEAGLVCAITQPIRKVIKGETNATSACMLNVRHQVAVSNRHFASHGVQTVGAIYDIVTGKVNILQ